MDRCSTRARGENVVTGINHVTFAVRDLDRALAFYRDVLGFRLRARWARGAYLDLADRGDARAATWICLELDGRAGMASFDDGHLALSVGEDDFAALAATLGATARVWKENGSEGASLYFEDPDAHKLEIHVGDLESRLAACRLAPYDEMVFEDVPAPVAEPAPFIW